MSLFSFRDIKFKSGERRGELGPLMKNQGEYDHHIYRYPLDIGTSYDKGHYMVIHINQQKATDFGGGTTNDPIAIQRNRAANIYKSAGANIGSLAQYAAPLVNGATRMLSTAASALKTGVDSGAAAVGVNSKDVTDRISAVGEGVTDAAMKLFQNASSPQFQTNFARTVERTKDTIVLYMPDTLAFDYAQSYAEPNLGGGRMLAAGMSLADTIVNGKGSTESFRKAGNAAAPFLLSYFADKNDLTKVAFSALTGTVVNPMIEVIYSSPTLRTFRFDFMFYPRSTKEGTEVQKIINAIRFHQSPEVNKRSKGYFMVPPSEFDIEFYANGKINENIDKVSTCVLENISVDYAPNGFAAYETLDNSTGLGKTGMPVAIRMSLAFKETEFMTKDNFQMDYLSSQSQFSNRFEETVANTRRRIENYKINLEDLPNVSDALAQDPNSINIDELPQTQD